MYDGSYDKMQDPIEKNHLALDITEDFKKDKTISVEFNPDKSHWKLFINNTLIFDEISAWIDIKGQRYTTSPNSKDEKGLIALEFTEKKIENQNSLGPIHELHTKWAINEHNLVFHTHIWILEEYSSIIFKVSTESKVSNLKSSDTSALNFTFPSFKNISSLRRTLSFKDTVFCPPQRDFNLTHGPVWFFNDNKDSILISGLNTFLVSPWIKKDFENFQKVMFGIHSQIGEIPADFSHDSIMVIDNGIRSNFQKWADLLRSYHNLPKKTLNPDLPTTYLGYYTDNGAAYYYHTQKGMKADQTLIAVKKKADELEIPYKYYHLDSWWYQKSTSEKKQKWLGWLASILGGALYGGALLWEPDPNFWDMSPKELSEKLDAPFTAHNRWFEPQSPYNDKFNCVMEGSWILPDDEKFWDHIMKYCKDNNIIVYEQDWMSNQIKRFRYLRNTLDGAERWLSQMATNAEKQGVTIQYCMETPAMVMQSIFYPVVTHCRTCDDYHGYTFKTYDIPGFTQASLLAHVLGLRPFKDVFKTIKYPLFKYRGERLPELECLLASLSTGPVAPGDQIDHIDKDIIMRSCRVDGKLLQPTFPLTAVDLVYIENACYYLASAESEFLVDQDLWKWFYVLTINLFPKRVQQYEYSLDEFDLPEREYIEYDWHSNNIRKVTDTSLFKEFLKFEQYKYRIYAPLFPNGIALLGNTDKYTTFNYIQFKLSNLSEMDTEFMLSGIKSEKILCSIVTNIKYQFNYTVNNNQILDSNELDLPEFKLKINIRGNNKSGRYQLNFIEIYFKEDVELPIKISRI